VRLGRLGIAAFLLAGTAFLPGIACAQIASPGEPGQGAPVSTPSPPPETTKEIIPDAEFEAAMPRVDGDIDAPLAPLPPDTLARELTEADAFTPLAAEDPELAQPLPPLSTFEVAPLETVDVEVSGRAVTVRYDTVIEGLDKIGLAGRFRSLSALEEGDGRAANTAMIAARAREDEALAVRLLQSLGYYDGSAISVIEQPGAEGGRLRAIVSATPGPLYRIGSIDLDAGPTIPVGLVDKELPLLVGDPLEADRIQGAEANLSLKLPQNGYPFAKVGQRDILLDEETHTAAYSLPVVPGPRARFGGFTTQGRRQAFGTDHIAVLARFKRGELYDHRMVDDLREALVATSLFSTVSVEPVRTGESAGDDTEYVNIHVRQQAGRPRTIAGEVGYSTGQGFRLEGSWTHRNLFPPEGALILTGVAGTQEQGFTTTFRRSNWKKRDRTLQLALGANHSDFEAFEAYTSQIAARVSYDSTPIWQKRWTYYYGLEVIGSNEDRYNYALGARDRGTWAIAAAPLFLGFDTSDNLLNPTRGFRIKTNLSPETSVRGGVRPYARAMVEGTVYYPVTPSLVVAGRARTGTIAGIARNDLPPSRRYYAGGGGSVRGFGYQELGPRSPDGRPVGGRSLVEFALEARYRFGDFGVVPFVDAGQVYEGLMPTGKDMRFGYGIGARYYTNFGPIRIDVARPFNRRRAESNIALYISIGQAF
jgi:translocation and assembly module TamA